MEGQYGEHYAQKVEDRLLHYLNELETMLPGKTHVDEVCVLEKNVSMEGTFTSLSLYFLESLLNYHLKQIITKQTEMTKNFSLLCVTLLN